MGNPSLDYLELLSDIRDAPIDYVLDQHRTFWHQKIGDYKREFEQPVFNAYHLGTIPSKIELSLINTWFIDPKINLQRVGLYADVIVFDDILGHILEKIQFSSTEELQSISQQAQNAIKMLYSLKGWVKEKIVKILPTERILKKIYKKEYFEKLIESSEIESTGNLPDIIRNKLNAKQKEVLSDSAGHKLIYKTNKALLLKELLDFVPSADDTFYDILCTKLNWNYRNLKDSRNLYILKKIRQKYLCKSSDAVLEIRKQDNLFKLRKFFREQINAYFGEDIASSSIQENIDEFSRVLSDQIKEADAELHTLKRKLGSDVIFDLTTISATVTILTAIDFGSRFAKFIPAAYGIKNIFDSVKSYFRLSNEIKRKPTFILGTKVESKSEEV